MDNEPLSMPLSESFFFLDYYKEGNYKSDKNVKYYDPDFEDMLCDLNEWASHLRDFFDELNKGKPLETEVYPAMGV